MRQTKQTIGVREVARKLNVTTKYVYDLLYCGKLLGAEKVARQWRIPVEAVEARLKQRGE
jgi:excisionase family DNA binding protein